MPLFSKDNSIRRSLVLAGGGVRLAYHAGVLMALEETALSFNHVDGTSGGIFGTAMMASGITPAEAAARWRGLKLRGFLGAAPLREGQKLQFGNGAAGIRDAIFPALGIDAARIRANSDFDATFNVCNFSRKAVESIPHTDVTTEHLVAGMSLPMFMPATNIHGNWYTDAVWIKDANMLEAMRRGAEEIWLVWCIGNTETYHKGYFNEYVHMIEISANAGVMDELAAIERENAARAQRGQAPVVLHIIKPEFPLPLDPDFFFKRIDADTLISMGYADTHAFLSTKKPFDFADLSTATAMCEADATLHFRQQFSGRAAWQDKTQQLNIRLAISLHQIDGVLELRSFSTLETAEGNSMPGFDNMLQTTGPGRLQASFSIAAQNGNCRVSISMCLTSAIDMLIGLDIQQAQVIITDDNGGESAYTFYQPAGARLKNATHLSVFGAMKPLKRWRMKWQTLQYLFQ